MKGTNQCKPSPFAPAKLQKAYGTIRSVLIDTAAFLYFVILSLIDFFSRKTTQEQTNKQTKQNKTSAMFPEWLSFSVLNLSIYYKTQKAAIINFARFDIKLRGMMEKHIVNLT